MSDNRGWEEHPRKPHPMRKANFLRTDEGPEGVTGAKIITSGHEMQT